MNGPAPGRPGIEARWTSSAKEAIGTSRSAASPVWFTLSHGILNEVYYPRIDRACLRDAEFLVVTRQGRFFEEKRDGTHDISPIEDGIPAFAVHTADPHGEFTVTKRFVTDPTRPTLLIDVAFAPHGVPDLPDLVFLAAPHLDNHGQGNTAWTDHYKGTPVVYASGSQSTLAVVSSAPLLARSVGYVGFSDGWQDLSAGRPLSGWDRADDGNVAMAVQIDLDGCDGRFTLALSFGSSPAEAGHHAVSSLGDGFEACLDRYRDEWRAWASTIHLPSEDALASTSAQVLATHEAKSFPGGLIASLSIPWGFAKGDGDLGGYHLVWPRDHVEAAGAFFAIGDHADGLRALSYLRATQEPDGHWAQNMWLDGTPFWGGIQMDETALPVLLVDLARSAGALTAEEALDGYWPMVRTACSYVVCNGPVTAQDRWEEDGGYSPFTLATEIAGLLTGADFADEAGEPEVARYLRETADLWDAHIESWCFATGTELAGSVGVDGYYVRIGAADDGSTASPLDGWIPIKNRPPGQDTARARSVVSPDALALVRFGLRDADDPRIRSTVKVIDATLREDLPYGPGWRRYNDDGYGEHPDGSPFDGIGQGRVWPLLTGERAHYELAAGRTGEAAELATVMRRTAGVGHLLPEQTWDAEDIPSRELWLGRPAGSAMPLVWAHAEYLKLLRSIADGAVFDLPRSVVGHRRDPAAAHRRFWRKNHKIQRIEPGASLRVELTAHASVHWSMDDWTTTVDTPTVDTGIGVYLVDLDTATRPAGTEVVFTMKWEDGWDPSEYRVRISET